MAEAEIGTGDDVLEKAALDGSMDYSVWPALLPVVLARIEKTVHTEFRIPTIPSRHPPARPPSPRFLAPLPSSDPAEAGSSQETDKENANPSSEGASANTNGAAPSSAPAALPKPIADMLDEITSVLRTNFSQYPPHTIQRLAELVLCPRRHYRNLVPYLHALDRVVHVTSGANTYPLPPAMPDASAMSLLANGGAGAGMANLSISTAAANSLGSDDVLGGALLTPIPWLARQANGGGSDDGSDAGSSSPVSAGATSAPQVQFQQHQQRQAGQLEGRVRTESTETIEGPNGMGSIETVSVSVNGIPSTGAGVALLTQRTAGVTQGELLRQEQQAGVVPVNQLMRHQQQQQQHQQQEGDSQDGEDAVMSEGANPDAEQEEQEIPHARGPEEIGPADTGPQSPTTASYIASGIGATGVRSVDLEAAVARRLQSPPAQQHQHQQQQQQQQQDGDDKAKRARSSPEQAAGLVPRSPKREAADELEPGQGSRKRMREDAESTAGNNTTSSSSSSIINAGQAQADHHTTTPEKKPAEQQLRAEGSLSTTKDAEEDAEGDVLLPDAAAAPEPLAGAQAGIPSSSSAPDHGGTGKGEGRTAENVGGLDENRPQTQAGQDAAGLGLAADSSHLGGNGG